MSHDARSREIKELAEAILSVNEREEFVRDPSRGRAGFDAAEKALRAYGKSSGGAKLAKAR